MTDEEKRENPWGLRVESSDACGHVLQLFDSIYLPQNETKNLVPLLDGGRVYDAPSIYVVTQNVTAED